MASQRCAVLTYPALFQREVKHMPGASFKEMTPPEIVVRLMEKPDEAVIMVIIDGIQNAVKKENGEYVLYSDLEMMDSHPDSTKFGVGFKWTADQAVSAALNPDGPEPY